MTEPIEEAARFFTQSEFSRSARACLDLIRRDPGHFDALHLMGVNCVRLGQAADALGYLSRAEAIRGDHPRLQFNIGNAFGLVQRFDRAISAFEKSLTLKPGDAGTANNLGLALRGAGREQDAIACFRAALGFESGHAPTRFNLARALMAAGDLDSAEIEFRILLDTLPPDTPGDRAQDIVNELAHTLMLQCRAEDSLAILRDGARRLGGKHPIWNESLILLTMGRYAEGWLAYEERWRAPNHEPAPADHQVLDLDRVAGRKVLVAHEQGRGDIIQFLRYIPLLAARGARVRVSLYDDLADLAREMPDIEQVAAPNSVVDYDLTTSIMSLPLAFRTGIDTVPADVPYLRTPANRVARMRHHLGTATRPRIGLAWSGSAASHARSALPAAMLEPLARQAGVEFHCLQKDILPQDQAWIDTTGLVATHAPVLRDFADTAALIGSMDLVISIDTAVAHLAGALAKPLWIMLPFSPDWRWMLGRNDSPWYPTARLFRQPTRGDWDGVVRAIQDAWPF